MSCFSCSPESGPRVGAGGPQFGGRRGVQRVRQSRWQWPEGPKDARGHQNLGPLPPREAER